MDKLYPVLLPVSLPVTILFIPTLHAHDSFCSLVNSKLLVAPTATLFSTDGCHAAPTVNLHFNA